MGLFHPTTTRAQLHVKPDASGDCSSWSTACDLQDAIGQAGGGSEIWIAEGTYTPGSNRGDSFTIDGNQDGVELYGGFDGTETSRSERDPGAHPVVLSGDIDGDGTRSGNSNNVVTLRGLDYYGGAITRATRIDGVAITGGNAVTDDDEYGGGLYCMGNASSGECSPTLTNIIFVDNYAGFEGGALYLNGRNDGTSTPLIRNAIFANNTSRQGGAIYNEGYGGLSSPNIEGSIFVDIHATSTLASGGAMYNAGFDNETLNEEGESAPTITNSIFWGNTGNDQIETAEASGATIEHSIVENGCPPGSSCDAATVDVPPPLPRHERSRRRGRPVSHGGRRPAPGNGKPGAECGRRRRRHHVERHHRSRPHPGRHRRPRPLRRQRRHLADPLHRRPPRPQSPATRLRSPARSLTTLRASRSTT